MKKSKIIGILLFFCGVCAGQSPIPVIQIPQIPREVKENVRFRVDHGYNVGIIIGIVNPKGTDYYDYGTATIAGKEKLNEDTIFEIGSITKVFTALLLVDMAERDEVNLDDPIEKYLPGSIRVPTYNGQRITLSQLAIHTSGLPMNPNNMTVDNPSNPFSDYSVKRMYDFISNYKLQRNPGTRFEYSNYGFGLLGHILALHGKTTYEGLVKQRITDKLGMADTLITPNPKMQRCFAKGYSGVVEVPHHEYLSLKGSAALRSTARDMLIFLAANMGLENSSLFLASKAIHKSRHQLVPNMHVGWGWYIRTIGDHKIVKIFLTKVLTNVIISKIQIGN